MTTPKTLKDLQPTEKEFQTQVCDLARLCHWTVNHHRKSIGGRKQGWVTATTLKGWPDLTLIKPPRLVFAELKVSTALSPEQEAVLALLRGCPGVEVYVWRPSDWDAITAVLRGVAQPG